MFDNNIYTHYCFHLNLIWFEMIENGKKNIYNKADCHIWEEQSFQNIFSVQHVSSSWQKVYTETSGGMFFLAHLSVLSGFITCLQHKPVSNMFWCNMQVSMI